MDKVSACTVNQPCLFPRVHIMERVARVKTYVVLSSAQYMRKSDQPLLWYTDRSGQVLQIRVPMADGREPLREKRAAFNDAFRSKSVRTLEQAWSKLPGRDFAISEYQLVIGMLGDGATLGEVGEATIRRCAAGLMIDATDFVQDYDVMPPVVGDPSTWMRRLTQGVGASAYYAGGTAIRAYMDHPAWAADGVDLIEQEWGVPAGLAKIMGHSTSTSVLDVLARGPLATEFFARSLMSP